MAAPTRDSVILVLTSSPRPVSVEELGRMVHRRVGTIRDVLQTLQAEGIVERFRYGPTWRYRMVLYGPYLPDTPGKATPYPYERLL